MREETILQKMCARDPAGLEALMDRYLPYVSAIVWNILRDCMSPEDCEETASDVFLAAWEQAGDLQPGRLGPGGRPAPRPGKGVAGGGSAA